MDEDTLGPIPEPTAEEPQLVPGGTDAIVHDEADTGLPRDLDPDENPAVDDALPDEVAERDEKKQEPDDDSTGDDAEAGTVRDDEHPDEDSVEPPA